MAGLKEIHPIFKSRLILVTTVMLVILGCETSISKNLGDKKEYEQAGAGRESPGPAKAVVQANQTNGSSANNDLSGIYISEITNNHPYYFTKRYKNLILTIEQHGNQITATDSADEIKLVGTLEGDIVSFEIFGGGSANYAIGNVVYGKWNIKSRDRFEGIWWAGGHNAGGEWDLRKVEQERIELFTIETGLERPFKLSEYEKFFDTVFTAPGNENIVFYIHGRGQDFETDFAPSMIPFVENYSGTRFVIIRWLSWGDSGIRPYQHAVKSALGVSKLLSALSYYKFRKPGNVEDRNITLLAHSMGNIPLKIFLEEYYENQGLQKSLLNAVILNSADVPRSAHRKWVEKIDFADDVYVIQHRGDLVLYVSNLFFKNDAEKSGPKLGTGFDTNIKIEDLASNARYLDLTYLNKSIHRHFNLPSNPEATRLFKLLLNGQDFTFPDPSIGLTERSDQAPIYYFFSGEKNTESVK